MLIWAPALWPETARAWTAAFERFFWQDGWLLQGVREFPRGRASPAWSMDVDAGPVIAGYGTAASAFGIGATRANGRLDRAYALSAEAMAASWPLPDGSLLIPRILSQVADSPYLGESALLFCLSRRPVDGSATHPATWGIPLFVGLMILFYLGTGLLVVASATRSLRRWRSGGSRWIVPFLPAQFGVWVLLTLAAVIALFLDRSIQSLLLVLSAQLFPRFARIGDDTSLAVEGERATAGI